MESILLVKQQPHLHQTLLLVELWVVLLQVHQTQQELKRATKQEMFRITADNTFSFGKGVLEESYHYDTGGGIQGNYNHDILTYGEIFYGYTNAVANFTFNVREIQVVPIMTSQLLTKSQQ